METILELAKQNGRRFLAPSRSWSEERLHLAYLDYFAGNGVLGCASDELRAIVRLSIEDATRGAGMPARAWAPRLRAWMEQRSDRMIHKPQQPNKSWPVSSGGAAFLNDL